MSNAQYIFLSLIFCCRNQFIFTAIKLLDKKINFIIFKGVVFVMGLGQKFGGKNRGKHGKAKKERQPRNASYKDIEMKNEHLETYYKGIGVMRTDEHDDFFAAMR